MSRDDVSRLVAIARDGYRWAEKHGDDWFPAVNTGSFSYRVGTAEHTAWYRGWWFYHHIVKRYQDLHRKDHS